MRLEDIKFKAKRLDNAKWVEGFYFRAGNTGNSYIQIKSGECIEVDPITVCQYTGLKDKDGKEIFENDIIIYKDINGERKGTINWNSKQTVFCFGCGYLFYFLPEFITVVGNKFDKEV